MASESESQLHEFRDALYEELAGGGAVARDSDPLLTLQRVTDVRTGDAFVEGVLEPLREVASAVDVEAAVVGAAQRFETVERFREAIYFARCFGRDSEVSSRLLTSRRYIEDAVVPATSPELLTDRDAVLDAATFASLWHEPARGEWLLNTTEIWQRQYRRRYVAQHSAFQKALSGVVERVEGVAATVAAVERLNRLQRLGSAVAVEALNKYHEREGVSPCPIEALALAEALAVQPNCPECGYKLGDAAPQADARRVGLTIERGLAMQQSRLARRVVSLILARPVRGQDARLEQFIRVVQGSDVAGLAQILDESLAESLRNLLEARATDPLSRLAEAYPEVTSENIEAAVGTFRRLLEAGLVEGEGVVRLAGEASS